MDKWHWLLLGFAAWGWVCYVRAYAAMAVWRQATKTLKTEMQRMVAAWEDEE